MTATCDCSSCCIDEKKLIDLSLSMIWTKQINQVSDMCVKVNLGEVSWSNRSPCGMWSWPEKKDEDCDGVLSIDRREGWHSGRVSAGVLLLLEQKCWGSAQTAVIAGSSWAGIVSWMKLPWMMSWSYHEWCSMQYGVGSPKEVSLTESLPWLGLKVLLALNLLLQTQPTSGGHCTARGIPWGGVQALWAAKAWVRDAMAPSSLKVCEMKIKGKNDSTKKLSCACVGFYVAAWWSVEMLAARQAAWWKKAQEGLH